MAAVVAVTGDVGAGKSSVSRLLERAGVGVRLDADALAAELWGREDVRAAALARWGGGILDAAGNVSHGAVAARIFTTPSEYAWCCGLLHPLVLAELRCRVRELRPGGAILEIPLLFEAGRPDWVEAVVFVTARREVRVARCRRQRGWDEAELRRREAFFLPSEERMRRSDFVVRNDGERDKLEAEVLRLAGLLQRETLGGGA